MSAESEKEELETLIGESLEKLDSVLRHIENVRHNCEIVGRKLIEQGEIDLGKRLIANGLLHDNSKFFGVEWFHLDGDATKSKLEIAIAHHNSTNQHHPEYWLGIENMPRLYLAELVCDWSARASEFGTSIREWVVNGASERFGYKKGDKTYKAIMEFVDMLCDKPFKQK